MFNCLADLTFQLHYNYLKSQYSYIVLKVPLNPN